MLRLMGILMTLGMCAGSEAPSTRTAIIETSAGDITVELYPDAAPVTVANFIRHAEAGHFNGGRFYRTVREDNDRPEARIDVIQGGVGFDGFPGATPIVHERTNQTGLTHRRGAISMARDEPGTATTEFFIVMTDGMILDAGANGRHPDGEGFAVFGYVTDGMATAETIWASPAGDNNAPDGFESQWLNPPIIITRVTILE
ncbi:peptidylprolyl isomerase [Hyphobacterium sp. HN65]|uniref:peptidylprolyl isomerase n=1 Tax=Hyphobacterium lacteum TaxID=3116575 RepID=A0ABU7LMP1_9PROT|nr:peptidylprolyl isomerase [Hyphobacterium sp. HN65]MEE2524859.1 peptidylprolyl isomerase [Hyphobacterium sp. HN65]